MKKQVTFTTYIKNNTFNIKNNISLTEQYFKKTQCK